MVRLLFGGTRFEDVAPKTNMVTQLAQDNPIILIDIYFSHYMIIIDLVHFVIMRTAI